MESHPDCDWNNDDYYRNERHQVNKEFDKKLQDRSIFTSKKSIEEERKKALSKVHDDYYPSNGYGGHFLD